jgi:hypothetical protein
MNLQQDLYESLPQKRILNSEEQDSVMKLMALQSNKKLVCDKVRNCTSKRVELKDISNIVFRSGQKGTDDLKAFVSILENNGKSNFVFRLIFLWLKYIIMTT